MLDIYFPSSWGTDPSGKVAYFLERHPIYRAFGRLYELSTAQLLWRCVINAREIPTNDELATFRAANN